MSKRARLTVRQLLLGSVAASALMAGTAFADPAPAPIWNGPYVGLNLGYYRTTVRANDITGWWQEGWTTSHDEGGVLGGVQAGYDWQFNAIVLGAEADIDAGSANGSVVLTPPRKNQTIPSLSTTLSGLATLRGRVGYALQPVPLLVYGTAGVAFGQVKNGMAETAGGTASWSNSATRGGYVVGGGGEYQIAPNWTVKAEALYVNLGSDTVAGPYGCRFNFRDTAVVARGGINFKF